MLIDLLEGAEQNAGVREHAALIYVASIWDVLISNVPQILPLNEPLTEHGQSARKQRSVLETMEIRIPATGHNISC